MVIRKISCEELDTILNLFASAKNHLRSQGIYQWDDFYPNLFVIREDLEKGEMYGVAENSRILAAVTLNDREPGEYAKVEWENEKALVIHRLVVDPNEQGRGIGKMLLKFSESFAVQHQYPSIHLDAYSGNPVALQLYERHGYQRRGQVYFPFRELPYICYEKRMTGNVEE
jgi:ribosomal protein S18 acetylase RimI-like enzyme